MDVGDPRRRHPEHRGPGRAPVHRQLLGQLVRAVRRQQPVAYGLTEHPDELTVVGVLTRTSPPRRPPGFVQYGDAGYPNLVDGDGALAIDYGVTGPPESYFVDAEGIVRAKQFGPLTDESMAQHLAEIGVGGRRGWLCPAAAGLALGVLDSWPSPRSRWPPPTPSAAGRGAVARAALPRLPGPLGRRSPTPLGAGHPRPDRRPRRGRRGRAMPSATTSSLATASGSCSGRACRSPGSCRSP